MERNQEQAGFLRIAFMITTLSLILWLGLDTVAAQAGPAQVLLIRHGEESPDAEDIHLSPQGKLRAEALVHFFTSHPGMIEFGSPVAVYAAKPKKATSSLRSIETCSPLAEKLGLRLNTDYEKDEWQKLAKQIRHSKEYDGKTVLICWTHDEIPDLAIKLGATTLPGKWKGKTFDRVWKIRFSGDAVTLEDLPQTLFPEDSK